MKPVTARVRLMDGRVEKLIGEHVAPIARKYDAIHRIALHEGFVAPKVVSYDERDGMLVLERIERLVSIRELYWLFMVKRSDEAIGLALMRRAGEILASLHLGLQSAQFSEWTPCASFTAALQDYGYHQTDMGTVPHAQLHGDFGFANIFVQGAFRLDSPLVVIDPCADGYSSCEDLDRGPVYLDVGKFLVCLEGLIRPSRQLFLDPHKIARLQNAFLDGYAAKVPYAVDRVACFAFAYALGRLYFSKLYPRSKWLAIRMLYNRPWKRNFPLERKLETLALGK
jgi:hypothetical protein